MRRHHTRPQTQARDGEGSLGSLSFFRSTRTLEETEGTNHDTDIHKLWFAHRHWGSYDNTSVLLAFAPPDHFTVCCPHAPRRLKAAQDQTASGRQIPVASQTSAVNPSSPDCGQRLLARKERRRGFAGVQLATMQKLASFRKSYDWRSARRN